MNEFYRITIIGLIAFGASLAQFVWTQRNMKRAYVIKKRR